MIARFARTKIYEQTNPSKDGRQKVVAGSAWEANSAVVVDVRRIIPIAYALAVIVVLLPLVRWFPLCLLSMWNPLP